MDKGTTTETAKGTETMTTATLTINPAKNKFETVKVVRIVRSGMFLGWTRIERANGLRVFVPNESLRS